MPAPPSAARFSLSRPITALIAALALLVLAAPPAGAAGSVSLDLRDEAARHPDRTVQAIVQLEPGADATAVRAAVRAAGGTAERELPLIGGIVARMGAAEAAGLAGMDGVRAVSLNAKVVSQGFLDPGALKTAYNQSIRVEKAWSAGFTGKGIGVAVIDSGLAGDLPDFRVSETDKRSRGVVSAVVNPRTADAADSFGHGTHIAGLIAGNGAGRDTGDPLQGRYAGAAPDANVIAVKADDGKGQTDVISLIDGLQFVVSHKDRFNIRIVNMSVRSLSASSYRTDPLNAAVEALWMHGVVVVAAAGNLGAAPDAVSYAPGNDPYVITVGAVDDAGTKSIEDDRLASWSSRGVTLDGFAKPDILAPGARLVAPLSPGSVYASACVTCVVDGQYIGIGGTSMATGVVSGAIATILQANPTWTPGQVKATLMKRSRLVTDGTGTATGQEVAVDKVLFSAGGGPEAPANGGLVASGLVDPATGTITAADESWAASSWGASSWGASSWGASSWGAAPGQWSASWAQSSFTGTSLDPAAFDPGNPQNCWQLARTGFSASSWGASSWGSDQISAAKDGCDQAATTLASSWGASSWGASSWGASSWGASSWGASSWGASSWGGAVSWSSAWDK